MSTSVCAQYDWSTAEPSIAIVEAIATLENIDPLDVSMSLDCTLFDHINPDALDTLITDDKPISISFALDEYSIRMDEDGLVVSQ
ncbi:HalOD1 output domain-containing protein [Natronobacterium texcoconense]|nr:HalOD1 output domain-containing protein [Natronobacterium texcoconense]